MADDGNGLALVLSGGGARAAYQVGFLRCLARNFPDLNIPIITGVSAGAINAAFLANHTGTFAEAVEELSELWLKLSVDQVFCVDTWKLIRNVFRWGVRLVSGGFSNESSARSLLDSTPLRELLQRAFLPQGNVIGGIRKNLQHGKLKAFAITGTNYATGQALTWVMGKEIRMWERPWRRSEATDITIDHIMSSASLPLLFPAVRVGNAWYGDGGIRQSAPLSPAIYLGAKRILAISTRHLRSMEDASTPVCIGYPPPAQIAGTLMNSIFLDALDQDVRTLKRTNQLLEQIPEEQHDDRHVVYLFAMRPSEDLGELAGGFEPELPYMFRYLFRGLGTHETSSPDWLSMVMFDPNYLTHLVKLGENDADKQTGAIMELMNF
ncbi:MAG: patatin-like phospholipase family protein [Deltaproteobacteria bacterium]|nr:patatin-like phospholipase family protein [Deltaproteobacteria bacterium]